MADASLSLDLGPIFIVAILIMSAVGLVVGFHIRRTTKADFPADFLSIALIGCAATVMVAGVSVGIGTPALLPLFFIAAFIIGHWLGSYVVHTEDIEFVRIGVKEDGFVHFELINGTFYNHPKHGLCRVPENNGELFAQVVRKVYHKVELTSPLQQNVILSDQSGDKWVWKGKPNDCIIDDITGMKMILIEDIKTTYSTPKGKIFSSKVPKTTVTIAYGSQIPRALLLKNCSTLDELNKVVATAVAKAVEVETKIISKLPMISAEQLIGIAANNPVIEVAKSYLDAEEKRKGDKK